MQVSIYKNYLFQLLPRSHKKFEETGKQNIQKCHQEKFIEETKFRLSEEISTAHISLSFICTIKEK